MPEQQYAFVAAHYNERAQAYVDSVDHRAGDDLDQIEDVLRGRGLARVLDLGCGGGHVSYRAARHAAKVTAYDLTPGMLHAVRREAAERGLTNITVRQGAAERLPFADASFDAVLSRFSAHHWQDWEAGLREARRVLKPGAQAIFIDVTAPADRVLDTHLQAFELLRDPSHVRDFTVEEWVAALGRSGFAVESVTMRKLRMDFAAWTARTHTSAERAEAVRAVQRDAPAIVREYFQIDADGSFDLDTETFFLRAA